MGCDKDRDLQELQKLISTHTSRVGCDETLSYLFQTVMISTHTSRVGCDFYVNKYKTNY